VSRARARHGPRAEAALAVSLALGLRAKELAALKWSDVYDDKGKVRTVVHLKTAYTKGGNPLHLGFSMQASHSGT
jgi:integrase